MGNLKKKVVITSILSGMGVSFICLPVVNSVVLAAEDSELGTNDILKKNNGYLTIPGDSYSIESYSLSEGSVSYTADSNEYDQGDSYEATISLENKDGNLIEVGTTITVNLPTEGIDMNSLDFSDPVLNEFFDYVVDKDGGQVTLTLKKEIIGDSKITVAFSGQVIGDLGESYPVSVEAHNPSGEGSNVINNNPNFKVRETPPNPPAYGFLNAFWGLSPMEVGQFIGKTTDTEGLPTGVFSRKLDLIQNFAQINYGSSYRLPSNAHYEFSWHITPFSGEGTASIIPDEVSVYNDSSGQEIPKSWYTVEVDNNRPDNIVWVKFKTFEEMEQIGGADVDRNTCFRVQLQAHGSSDTITYHTSSSVYIKEGQGNVGDNHLFVLNNKFSNQGESNLFPTISAEDKTFYVGELNDDNSKEKLLENVKAKDTVQGDISKDLEVDFSQLNPNVVGDYEVTYTVKNSSGHVTSKKVTIHIIDKEKAAPITVRYVDEDGTDIIPPEILEGKVSDPYTTTAKDFPGYALTKEPENAKGEFTLEPQTVTYIYQGQLIFLSAPSEINFGEHVLPESKETYSIESFSDNLKVKDYRSIGSTWNMSVKLVEDFKGVSLGKNLESTLFYFDSKGNKKEITTDSSVNIYSKETVDHDEVNISSEWSDKKEGLELEVPPGKALVDEYQGVVEWNLENGVPNR